MPGSNCAIFGCGTCRNQKEIGIFKLPAPKDEIFSKWRSDLLSVITKDRVVDAKLKNQIDKDTVSICERHFNSNDVLLYPTRKLLREGAIPTLHLPEKSCSSNKSTERSRSTIEKREIIPPVQPPPEKNLPCYKDFADFLKKAESLKLNGWLMKLNNGYATFLKINPDFLIPSHEIYVDQLLHFTIRIFAWQLPVDHLLYTDHERSMVNITISRLLCTIETHSTCSGISVPNIKDWTHVNKHIMPKAFHPTIAEEKFETVRQLEIIRSVNCEMLLKEDGCCRNCVIFKMAENKKINRKKKVMATPAKLHAPVTMTSPERLLLTIQGHRKEKKDLQQEISLLRKSLDEQSVQVTAELHNDFQSIFEQCSRDINPFMKLFWDEQIKYIKSSPSQVRYHPMIIKFCLGLYAKSPAAYEQLRLNENDGTGLMVLPSKRTLRDYRNYIRPTRGFNSQIVAELSSKTKDFSSLEKYIVLSFDEMKIQDDLVYDKNTGELIGFIDLGDTDVNRATLANMEKIATHVLVFLVKSVMNPLSYSFATFATSGVTSYQLFPIFWRAVSILELQCKLKVLATTCDGASQNRKFYTMHTSFNIDDQPVTFKTPNIYAQDSRFLYFFSDAPHLVKTVRNCLSNSGSHKCSRYMWNSNQHLLWSHISKMYYEDSECGLQYLPKLKLDHVNLTAYSVMNVRLATQVLSETVGKTLRDFGPKESAETAKLCLLMDKFFDCCNVSNTKEHKVQVKTNRRPYTSKNDERFTWLQNDFLNYFAEWKSSIDNREGFTATERNKMFISWQSYDGLQRTVYALIESVIFLLDCGMPYVLTSIFNQDDLENYFGKQRGIGHRRDNPTVFAVGYNDNVIKSQFSIQPLGGNVSCKRKKWEIDDTPLPKK